MYRGHMVTINNNGVLTAYRVDSGEEVHRARIATSGKSFSSSPVAADGRIFIASEDGDVFVLRGEPGYELLATHPMGEIVMATPAISDGLLAIRTLGHVVGIAEDSVR
jgi:outer membrane protein assembly factor BamB